MMHYASVFLRIKKGLHLSMMNQFGTEKSEIGKKILIRYLNPEPYYQEVPHNK